jgi:putative protease
LRRLPELLAPAGSPEALQAAIAAGADAVYLSGKRFGARKFAANFDEQALAQAIDYAHLQGVNVYVTVNTLVRENELIDVADYLLRLYEMGTDAVLLQDLGIALLARRIVPELEKHASTQMTIHNQQGALWAARAGFKRVVLAREVSLDEIKDMKSQGIGLEVFVHGALCYSYSGQCLLSSAIGGRSGNRGMCAQPCRKPYVLLRGERDRYGRPTSLAAQPQRERFLISTRDLCVYRHLDRIVRSPVGSLKIEGRMKSPEYVAIVTSIYRKALDAIFRGKWSPTPEDERDLALAFNRDFTEGHLLGATDVMGREMSDNRGVLIGSVVAFDVQRGEAAVRLSGPLCPEKGDGLVFLARAMLPVR